MKCQQCSKDAPAETDPQSGRLRCSQCHAFFGTGTTQTSAVRHARDILQKWSTADLLDQISSFPQVPPLADPVGSDRTPGSGLPEEAMNDEQSAVAADAESSVVVASSESEPEESASGEPSEILSLSTVQRHKNSAEDLSAASDSEQFTEAFDEAELEDTPQLSILRSEESVQPINSQDDESATELAGAENGGSAAIAESKQTKKSKRRHVARPPMKRRVSRPAAETMATFAQQSEAPQQGMDAMKKHFRVDRPVAGDQTSASDVVSSPDGAAPTAVDPRAQDAVTSRRFRIDTAEAVEDLTDGHGRIRSQGHSHQRYIDEAHEAVGLRGPHFAVSAPRRSSLTSLTGQFLAYTGVLGLTIGTAIVIYGHFGGYSEYTPTGWLVTTVAQMLLFLGIINLVSGGMEQNNDDVSRRINVLGEQLMRIEQVTESAMRGPRIPVERYAGTASAEEVSSRETVSVENQR